MRWWFILGSLISGCPSGEIAVDPDPGPGSLIDHTLWLELSEADDPFASHRLEAVVCPEWARQIEGDIYEVETDDCNYVSLAQPSLRPLNEGDHVELVFWHLWLWAPMPAQGHVAIQIGDWIVADEQIEIPGPEESFNPVVTVPHDLPAGVPIVFHLHNHGVNSWRLLSIERAVH